MKNIGLMCCLLIGFTVATYAQTTHPGAPEERAKGLQKLLNLTDRQTEKIAAINKGTIEYCENMKKAAHGTSKNSIRALRAATIKRVRSVLTPDQAAKYDVLVKQTKNDGLNDCVSAIY